MKSTYKFWTLKWRSKSKLDGKSEYFMFHDGAPLLFRTRDEARKYNNDNYGYIAERLDLRQEPHGWKVPITLDGRKLREYKSLTEAAKHIGKKSTSGIFHSCNEEFGKRMAGGYLWRYLIT